MTVRNVARRACVTWCFLASSLNAQVETGAAGESCPGVRWTAPKPWRSPEGYGLWTVLPTILPMHGRTLWIAQALIIHESPTSVVWPLARKAARPGSGSDQIQIGILTDRRAKWKYVSMPPGLRAWWSFPRPAVDEQGIAHVVWGENGDSAFTDHLWYARYGGERWGAPQLIPANHRFMWGLGTVSTLVARRDTLHLVAMGEGSNLIYLRRAHGEWTAHKVDVPLEAITGGYPSLTVLSDGRLVLVAQGPAVDTAKRSKPGGQLTSRAFATWSDDGGVSWARSVALSSSDAEPAHEFHLLQSPNGVLRAIWYQMTDSLGVPAQQSSLGGSPGRVHIAESRDRGARWRLLAPSPLLNNAYSLDAQPLDSTTLAIVLVDRAAEEVLLTTWSNEWRPFVHIKSQRDPQATLFGRDDAQRLVLTWATEQGPPRWFLSMVMTLTACT